MEQEVEADIRIVQKVAQLMARVLPLYPTCALERSPRVPRAPKPPRPLPSPHRWVREADFERCSACLCVRTYGADDSTGCNGQPRILRGKDMLELGTEGYLNDSMLDFAVRLAARTVGCTHFCQLQTHFYTNLTTGKKGLVVDSKSILGFCKLSFL